jgi:hypothetical protein
MSFSVHAAVTLLSPSLYIVIILLNRLPPPLPSSAAFDYPRAQPRGALLRIPTTWGLSCASQPHGALLRIPTTWGSSANPNHVGLSCVSDHLHLARTSRFNHQILFPGTSCAVGSAREFSFPHGQSLLHAIRRPFGLAFWSQLTPSPVWKASALGIVDQVLL